jgi:hypothetical protein
MNRGLYVSFCSLALVAGWLTPKLIKRLPPVPPRGDPTRFLWAQFVLYVTAFVILAATVVVRLWPRLAGGE